MARLGDQLGALLAARGVEVAFATPSPRAASLSRGLKAAGLKLTTARGEQGAGFMAEGYARATGKTAACLIGGGQGLASVAPALAQARASATPMLVLAACAPSPGVAPGLTTPDEPEWPESYGVALARFARRVTVAEEVPEALDAAMAAITAGLPGPALIEISRALLEAEAPALDRPPAPPPPPPAPTAAETAELIMRLMSAKRPVLILGAGAVDMGAARAMALAEALNAPTILSSDAAGLLPPGHPLRLGGPLHARPVRTLLWSSDCALAIGLDFTLAEWGFEGAEAPAFATDSLIRVGLDPAEMRPPFTPAQDVRADPALTAQTLLDSLPRSDARPPDLAEIRRQIEAASPQRLRRHQPMLDALWEILPDAIVIGEHCEPARQGLFGAVPPASRRWWTSASALGAQGYALPAAIGARIGTRRPVLALVGDGGALRNIGELATAIQSEAHVMLLVWNNSGGESLRESIGSHPEAEALAGLPPTDFQALARAFGASYGRVHGLPYFHEAMKKATHRPLATVLELREEFWFET